MSKKLLALITSVFLGATLLAQTSGKISGVITDKASGDPLPGVNIAVANSTLGASTDVDGFYVILNVPVGAHDVMITYIGYKSVTITGLRVFVDNTTEVSRALEESVNEGDIEEVVAKKVLIRKSETNSRQIKTSDEIKNLPVTSVTGVVAVTAGVVNREGSSAVNIRGGRSEETAYIVDGVNQNSAYDGASRSRVNKNAIEEVTVQSGGFGAEFGGVMSGLIQTTTKTGSKNYSMILEASMDGFGDKQGDTFLGGKVNQYRDINLSFGGPLIPGNQNHFFFVSADMLSIGDNASSYISNNKTVPYEATNIVANYKANLTEQITLRLGGVVDFIEGASYSHSRWFFGDDAVQHHSKFESSNISTQLQLTHVLDKNTYYTVRANQLLYKTENGDSKYWDKFEKYGDKDLNEYTKTAADFATLEEYEADAVKYGDISGFGSGANTPGTIFYEDPAHPGDPSFYIYPGNQDGSKTLRRIDALNNIFNSYGRNFELTRDFSVDVFHKFDNHLIKIGGGYKTSEIRRYSIAPEGLTNSAGNMDFSFETWNARAFAYGYDVYGSWSDDENADYLNGGVSFNNPNEAKNGEDGARTPESIWFYANDEVVFDDLILTLGLRYDHFNSNWINFKDAGNPTGLQADENGTFVFDPRDYKDAETYNEIQPRLGFAFPVDENTKFSANFSKTAQLPNYNVIYTSMRTLYNALDSEGSTINNPNLKPQTSLNYEVAVNHQISEDIVLTARTYYREISDLVSLQRVNGTHPQSGNFHYFTYTNIDYSDTKGVELALETRRINNVRFFGNYTFASALGTGSSAGANSRVARDDSQEQVRFEQVLEQDVPHQLNFNVDYRFFEGEGPSVAGMKVFEHMGINLLYNFQSGRPYTSRNVVNSFREISTRFAEIDSKVNGKRRPSITSLDLRVDKSFFANIASQRVEFNVFMNIENLLDKENVLFVYRNTGDPRDDGWLADSRSLTDVETDSDYKRDAYKYLLSNPANFGKPRTVKLGLRVEF